MEVEVVAARRVLVMCSGEGMRMRSAYLMVLELESEKAENSMLTCLHWDWDCLVSGLGCLALGLRSLGRCWQLLEGSSGVRLVQVSPQNQMRPRWWFLPH
jgi:hypothetical protein